MLTLEGIQRALEACVGPEQVLTAPAETALYRLGSVQPRFVVQASTVAQAAEVVALAGRERLALVPWGQGTQMHLGHSPQRYDLALVLRRLSRILEYDRANLTLTAEAGVPLSEVYRLSVPQRQFLPLGQTASSASLGGLLVTNTSGVKRWRYGGVRDLLLGVTVALPDGAVARFGGRVVKNVAGYDMNKLFIGSLGTFGVVLETTYRLAAWPEDDRLLLAAFPSVRQAVAAAQAVRASALLPSALLLLPAEVITCWGVGPLSVATPQVLLGLNCDGLQAAVARQMQEAQALCQRAGGETAAVLLGAALAAFWQVQEGWCQTVEGGDPARLQVRLGTLPASLEIMLGHLARTPRFCPAPIAWLADAAQGQIWAHVPLPARCTEGDVLAVQHWLQEMREALPQQQGYVLLEYAPLAWRPHLDVWGAPPGAALLALYKQRFDPHAVLNPGRYVTGL
ncbi:MAG: FAD-binding oxidoreductase [Candidatus Tectimicrobiota bacterium]